MLLQLYVYHMQQNLAIDRLGFVPLAIHVLFLYLTSNNCVERSNRM